MQKKNNCVIMGEILRKMKKNGGVSEKGMRRKRKLEAVLGLTLVLGVTGCAGRETVHEDAMAEAGIQGNNEADGGLEDAQKDNTNAPVIQESEWEREEPVPASGKEQGEEGQTVDASQGTEHLSGKVQNPQADGMTLAQTTLMDEEGMVTLLDVKDAKKIPVKFTEGMRVEHWTIQGGGAGIDMQDAVVSDLKESMTVELEGYYDGEVFMATKVIMEEDV